MKLLKFVVKAWLVGTLVKFIISNLGLLGVLIVIFGCFAVMSKLSRY